MHDLYSEKDLLDRIAGPDDRRLALLVGSAIAMPIIPGAKEMLTLIAEEYAGDIPERHAEFQEPLTGAPNPYQHAFSLLLGSRGPVRVNHVIRRAVLSARKEAPSWMKRPSGADRMRATTWRTTWDMDGWKLTPDLGAIFRDPDRHARRFASGVEGNPRPQHADHDAALRAPGARAPARRDGQDRIRCTRNCTEPGAR